MTLTAKSMPVQCVRIGRTVQDLATELGEKKWQYRALAQLGVAAFYNGDLATAGKNVASALAAATKNGDGAAQVRFLTMLGIGMREAHMNEEALTYFDNALKIASTIPDIGYPFFTKEALLEDLIDVKRTDAAQKLADEILAQAQQRHHPQAEAIVLTLEAHIAVQRHDDAGGACTLSSSRWHCLNPADSSGISRMRRRWHRTSIGTGANSKGDGVRESGCDFHSGKRRYMVGPATITDRGPAGYQARQV